MGKSSPKPPDPAQLANQQTEANRQAGFDTLRFNAQDRTNPFGSVTFQRDENGIPTGQEVTLSPEIQAIFDPLAGTAANLAGQLPQEAFRLADVPQGLPLADAFFQQGQQQLQPGFDRQLRNLEIRAAERGLPIGSEAFDDLFQPALQEQGRALSNLALGAVQLTPQEEQRQISNAVLERQLPFQEAQQSLGLLNSVPVPGFAPQPSAGFAAPDVGGLAQQSFQNQTQLASDRNAALGSILGSAANLAFTPINPLGSATLAGRFFG